MRSRSLYSNKLTVNFGRKKSQGKRGGGGEYFYVSFKSLNVNAIVEEFEKRGSNECFPLKK